MQKKYLTLLIFILFTGCSNVDKSEFKLMNKLNFQEIEVPLTDSEKRKIQVSDLVSINEKSYPLKYNVLMKTGDKMNGETFGLVKDINSNPIKIEGKEFICNGVKNGSGPDHTTLLTYKDRLFMMTQFECSPSAIYLVELNQAKNGHLSVKENSLKFIDQSSVNGGYVHCAGIATPWGSHLGSEEYEPDAKEIDESGKITYSSHYNNTNLYFKNIKKSNPYYYGWIPEIKIINDKVDTKITKHYAMGRFSHELAYVMPDKKSIYLSDDGTNVGLFMFIADREKDLSSGFLYGAKVTQMGNNFKLDWINLGHANDKEIKDYVEKKPKFSDMFESVYPNSDGSCPSGYTSINTTNRNECLKIKKGMQKYASRLESRRYLAIKGGTTEFNKEEGITYNKKDKKLYISMSRIEKGMEDFKAYDKANPIYDKGGNNHIRLKYNKCGIVYSLDINTKRDSDNKKIKSNFIATNMKPLIVGEEKNYTDKNLASNECNINKIANPDNLTYLPKYDTLIIGEDTNSHQNDMLWAYNVKDKKLTRILTSPYGSEVTSPFWYPNINGYGYLMSIIQHPFSESDKDKLQNKSELESLVGVIEGFPKLN